MNTHTQPTEQSDQVKRDPATDNDTISFQLQSARVNIGLSIADLSKQTGISKTVLLGYERGRTKPGAREIRLLCAALHISPNRLLFGSDEFEANPSEFTSLFRKVRARPELGAILYSMCIPLVAQVMDEDEIASLFRIVAALMRARNPEASGHILNVASEAIAALDKITMADGAIKISAQELLNLMEDTRKKFEIAIDDQK